MTGLFIGIGLVVAAVLLMVLGILRAPSGYQDRDGFHKGTRD